MVSKAKAELMQDNKFAQGMCFRKLFCLFLIASVFGAIYEDILIFVQTWFVTGTGVWMLHRGVIYGPFNVVYGFGAVALCLILARKPYKWWKIFLGSALLGGAVEYIISFLQEKVLHAISWDYHDEFLNINGRTTIPFMLFWGVLGLALVKVIYPWLSKWIERIPVCVGETLFWVLLIFMIADMLVSWTALLRQMLRQQKIPPVTPVGRFYDDYYTDDFLRKYYPNMIHKEGER